MSLTSDDAQQIRKIVREEIESVISTRIDPRFDRLEGKLEALESDVKDIYGMITDLQKLNRRVAHFEQRDLEQKILTAYKDIVSIASDAGIELPRA